MNPKISDEQLEILKRAEGPSSDPTGKRVVEFLCGPMVFRAGTRAEMVSLLEPIFGQEAIRQGLLRFQIRRDL